MRQKQNLTIDDIARDLGVSKTTISRAISGKGRIGAETRARVLEYIEKCNYRPSFAAKGLAESRSYNLALVLPRSFIKLDLPFVRLSMSSICEEAYLHDYNVLICLSVSDTPDSLLRTLDNRKVDGVILSRTVEDDMLVKLLTEREIPFATIGSLPRPMRGLAAVESDHDQIGGCRAFSREFLRRADGKVALIGNDMDYIVNQSRSTGFQQAVQDLNFPPDQLEIHTGLGTEAACRELVDQLLDRGFRNILSMDDDLCRHILSQLKERNMRIPDQVQVGSLYDGDYLQNYDPPVSALQFDAAALGQAVCRELIRFLKGEPHDPTPMLGYQVCLRQSTR